MKQCCCFRDTRDHTVSKRLITFNCTNIKHCHRATTCYWGQHLSRLTKWHTKVILFQLCCVNCQGKMCNPSLKWKTFTVSWRMYLITIALENMKLLRKREASLLGKKSSRSVIVLVWGCACVLVFECEIRTWRPSLMELWTAMFINGWHWNASTCCNTTVMSVKTYMLLGWLCVLKTSYCTFFNCAAF